MTLNLDLPSTLTRRFQNEVDRRGLLAEECAIQLLAESLSRQHASSPRIEAAAARAQALVRRYVPAEVSLSDELIAERRAAAERE